MIGVVAGYREHVDLGAEELARLEAVVRVRWVVLNSWEFCMGRRNLADTAREWAQARHLAKEVASRARAAFASTATP